MTSEQSNEGKTAVLVLGCPQVPVQTGLALYLMSALRKKGVKAVLAGNRAARFLVEVSDPERHYVGEVMDIDRYIDEIAEKKRSFDYHFIFIHNDAGVSYAATVQSHYRKAGRRPHLRRTFPGDGRYDRVSLREDRGKGSPQPDAAQEQA